MFWTTEQKLQQILSKYEWVQSNVATISVTWFIRRLANRESKKQIIVNFSPFLAILSKL